MEHIFGCPACGKPAKEVFAGATPLDVTELLFLVVGSLICAIPFAVGEMLILRKLFPKLQLTLMGWGWLTLAALVCSTFFVYMLLIEWVQARQLKDGVRVHYLHCPHCGGRFRVVEHLPTVPTRWFMHPQMILAEHEDSPNEQDEKRS